MDIETATGTANDIISRMHVGAINYMLMIDSAVPMLMSK